MNSMYDLRTLHRAAVRGYNDDAHRHALLYGSEDDVARTHPSNWLNEGEVEEIENCQLCKDWVTGPPHFASPYCESGHRNHCSCDVCF